MVGYVFSNLLETLNAEYKQQNYDKIFKLNNLKKLQKELKIVIAQELFAINYDCTIYKESILWFNNVKTNKERLIKNLEKKILDEEELTYISFYFGSHFGIIVKNYRLKKICQEFVLFLKKQNYTKLNLKFIIVVKSNTKNLEKFNFVY